MKIPTNMTEDEVVSIINKIATRLAPKFTFAFFEAEDIRQEAYLIAVDALDRYDENKPLENFLFAHINNRLKNFKRDNYYRFDQGKAEEIQTTKKRLLEPVVLDDSSCISRDDSVVDDIYIKNMKDKIDRHLPANLRADYLRMQTGVPLSKQKRLEVEIEVKKIIGGDHEER
jgi:DNA-directed RNA polymerase specialized sigma24 family protein